jgi:Tfp pilus assembly protein PilO
MSNNLKSTTRLFVTNELILSKVFMIWAILTIVIFGAFGVGPLSFGISKKIALYKEMLDINYQMNVKLLKLSDLSGKLKEVENYVPFLETNIPEDLNTHSYMVLFMQEASLSGFGVKTFLPSTENDGGEVPIVVALEGYGDVSALVSRLESLPRVTVIDFVKYENRDDSAEVTINLRIFNL